MGQQQRALRALQRGKAGPRQWYHIPAAAASRQEAADSSSASGARAAAAPGGSAEIGLLQQLLATCSLADGTTLLLAAVLGGAVLLGAAEPAAAAVGAAGHAADAASSHPQLLGDLAEDEAFWGNVLRYISYFFSGEALAICMQLPCPGWPARAPLPPATSAAAAPSQQPKRCWSAALPLYSADISASVATAAVLLGTAYIAVKPLIELMKRPGTAVLVVAGTAGLFWFVSFTVSVSDGE